MSAIDWIILLLSLLAIVAYGIYKTRNVSTSETYLRGDNSLPWYSVGLSVMATQASAITFLSAPGQAYTDGMRFVQFYFGLPIAMIILCAFIVPVYHRLKVYTAYEFLENRFDKKTRTVTALLFLIQRGIASGLTIFAPAIIFSVLLDWNIIITNILIGTVVIIYTVSGGTKAVSYTQLVQMSIILAGMLIAGILVVKKLPEEISFTNAVQLAGKLDRLNIIDLKFDIKNQYNIWSGLIGGLFLALSYFGTDQSQVSRYLNGRSADESKTGLLFNGLVKIPMQFSILFIGAMLYIFYLFIPPPVHFNPVEIDAIKKSRYSEEYTQLEEQHNSIRKQFTQSATEALQYMKQDNTHQLLLIVNDMKGLQQKSKETKEAVAALMQKNDITSNSNDVNYIFLSFILNYLPHGIIGLLVAVIVAASMSSTSSELNALASTFVVDIYKRNLKKEVSDATLLKVSKWATVAWGIVAIIVAMLCINMGSLIEAVNKLGSYFYGTILGIFLLALFFKNVKGASAFYAALLSQVMVFVTAAVSGISFLWFNVIGAMLVVLIGNSIHFAFYKTENSNRSDL